MKTTTKHRLQLGTVLTLLGAAIAVNWRASLREVATEVMYKASFLFTILASWAGEGAHEGMKYLNNNAAGVGVLLTAVGVVANIYYMHKGSKVKEEDKEEQ